MGTSGNPAKKAAAKKAKVSDVSAFKKRRAGVELELPSGLMVKAKRVELQSFILQGNVPNPLMDVVSEALQRGQKANIPQMMGVEDGKIDLDQVRDMYEMVNAVICASVSEPKVHAVPTVDDLEDWNTRHPDQQLDDPDELRDDELLYVDEIDDEDKMFIFQWAQGGTDDLARFRQEAAADLAALAEVQGAGAAAQ